MSIRRSVLILAPSAYPLGGVAEWLDYLVPGLAERGWLPTVGLVSGGFHDVPSYLRRHPFPRVVEISNPTGSHEGRLRAIQKAILEVEANIVLATNIGDTYAAVERVRAMGRPYTKVAMALHGVQPDLFDDLRAYDPILDGVIGTNRLACELAAVDAGVSRDRILYAPCGVEVLAEDPAPKENDALQIVFSGRIERFPKRVFDIPEILKRLEEKGLDYHLQFAGTGPDLSALQEECAEKLARHRVSFLGFVSPDRLSNAVYRNADVLIVTSQWETGPLVLFEAMMHKVAVVSSTFVGSGLEGSLQDGSNCLTFPIGDADAAANAISRLLQPDLRRKLTENAYRFVRAKYTRERSVEKWHRALDAILSRPERRPTGACSSVEPRGRLDRYLGTNAAESVRRFLGIRFTHDSAGGEWPHSFGGRQLYEPAFWARTKALDTIAPT